MRGFASLWRHGGFGLLAMLALLALAFLGFAFGIFGDTTAEEMVASPREATGGALLGEAAGGALIGALATGLVGVLLFAHARHQDEAGVREMLATELDLITKELDWPEDLMPILGQPPSPVVVHLRPTWATDFAAKGFEAVQPRLLLLTPDLVARTLGLYRRLSDYHAPSNRPRSLDEPIVAGSRGSSTVEGMGLVGPVCERAALSLAAAQLAHDLSASKARRQRAADLEALLQEKMPEAVAQL